MAPATPLSVRETSSASAQIMRVPADRSPERAPEIGARWRGHCQEATSLIEEWAGWRIIPCALLRIPWGALRRGSEAQF